MSSRYGAYIYRKREPTNDDRDKYVTNNRTGSNFPCQKQDVDGYQKAKQSVSDFSSNSQTQSRYDRASHSVKNHEDHKRGSSFLATNTSTHGSHGNNNYVSNSYQKSNHEKVTRKQDGYRHSSDSTGCSVKNSIFASRMQERAEKKGNVYSNIQHQNSTRNTESGYDYKKRQGKKDRYKSYHTSSTFKKKRKKSKAKAKKRNIDPNDFDIFTYSNVSSVESRSNRKVTNQCPNKWGEISAPDNTKVFHTKEKQKNLNYDTYFDISRQDNCTNRATNNVSYFGNEVRSGNFDIPALREDSFSKPKEEVTEKSKNTNLNNEDCNNHYANDTDIVSCFGNTSVSCDYDIPILREEGEHDKMKFDANPNIFEQHNEDDHENMGDFVEDSDKQVNIESLDIFQSKEDQSGDLAVSEQYNDDKAGFQHYPYISTSWQGYGNEDNAYDFASDDVIFAAYGTRPYDFENQVEDKSESFNYLESLNSNNSEKDEIAETKGNTDKFNVLDGSFQKEKTEIEGQNSNSTLIPSLLINDVEENSQVRGSIEDFNVPSTSSFVDNEKLEFQSQNLDLTPMSVSFDENEIVICPPEGISVKEGDESSSDESENINVETNNQNDEKVLTGKERRFKQYKQYLRRLKKGRRRKVRRTPHPNEILCDKYLVLIPYLQGSKLSVPDGIDFLKVLSEVAGLTIKVTKISRYYQCILEGPLENKYRAKQAITRFCDPLISRTYPSMTLFKIKDFSKISIQECLWQLDDLHTSWRAIAISLSTEIEKCANKILNCRERLENNIHRRETVLKQLKNSEKSLKRMYSVLNGIILGKLGMGRHACHLVMLRQWVEGTETEATDLIKTSYNCIFKVETDLRLNYTELIKLLPLDNMFNTRKIIEDVLQMNLLICEKHNLIEELAKLKRLYTEVIIYDYSDKSVEKLKSYCSFIVNIAKAK